MLGKFRQKGAVRISLIAATLSTAGILLATASAGADEMKPLAASAKPSLQFHRKAPPLAEPSRFWFGAEFLLWSTKRASLPPLATVGSPADPLPGALGQPGTRVLFGGGPDGSSRYLPGFRLRGGYAITNEWAVEASGFWLQNRSSQFAAQSGINGLPVISRPVVDALAGNENTYVDSFPALLPAASRSTARHRFGDWKPMQQSSCLGAARRGQSSKSCSAPAICACTTSS